MSKHPATIQTRPMTESLVALGRFAEVGAFMQTFQTLVEWLLFNGMKKRADRSLPA